MPELTPTQQSGLNHTFTIPWPKTKHGELVPHLSVNGHPNPFVSARRSRYLREHVYAFSLAEMTSRTHETIPVRKTLRLTLLRGRGQKLLDRDGVFIALKPAVDGLKDAGWIVDDSEKWLDYDSNQKRSEDGSPAILVHIFE